MRALLFAAAVVIFSPPAVLAEEHVHGMEIPPGESSPDSLYLLDSIWTAASGKTLTLRSLRGKPRLLALFYASCESACPLIVDTMKRLRRELGGESKKLGFVLVTFDTEADTPEVLKRYAKKRDLDDEDWLLLGGSADDTQELAVLLGSKYKRMGPASFSHSNLIALLDREGRIVARAKSLEDVERLAGEVRRFLAKDSGD